MRLGKGRGNTETKWDTIPTQTLIEGENRDGRHRMVATSIQRCASAHFNIGDA